MGIFYTRKIFRERCSSLGDPDGIGDGGGPEINMARLILALAALFVILLVGIYCSQHEIQPWDTILPATFQVSFGGVMGVLIGEKVSHKK